MDIHLADVTLHVDQSLNPQELEKLEHAIRQKEGVVSVHVNPDKAHLIVVEYNPKKVHSGDLMSILRSQGLNGELIGL
ncbi:MAG: ATP-binding protein [Gammaproteobacteria bacterium]|nr:ATP-binding protein [Gammaproteobacteria bacterium]HXK55934.1 ATP-binding protein [Gammaproteobacteria bacterium]